MRNLLELVRNLYGVEEPQGCSDAEIAAVKAIFGSIPPVLEEFYRSFGHTGELNVNQDDWVFPQDFQRWEHLARSDHLLLLCENQGVCRAEIRREDLSLPDPPVYTQMADDDPWLLSAPALSAFLEAALTYEAVFQLRYSPEEYYWLTEEEAAVLRSRLKRHDAVLKNWMELEITFYSSRPDNLAAVMDAGDHYEVLYGAATEEGYAALRELMEGLGEPI